MSSSPARHLFSSLPSAAASSPSPVAPPLRPGDGSLGLTSSFQGFGLDVGTDGAGGSTFFSRGHTGGGGVETSVSVPAMLGMADALGRSYVPVSAVPPGAIGGMASGVIDTSAFGSFTDSPPIGKVTFAVDDSSVGSEVLESKPRVPMPLSQGTSVALVYIDFCNPAFCGAVTTKTKTLTSLH